MSHVVTGKQLQDLAAVGRIRPLGPRVLVRAIFEEHHEQYAELNKGLDGKTKRLDVREATAFEVMAIGPMVPREWGLERGMIVIHNSAVADVLDHTDPLCPYQTVHYEDLLASPMLDQVEAAGVDG